MQTTMGIFWKTRRTGEKDKVGNNAGKRNCLARPESKRTGLWLEMKDPSRTNRRSTA